MTCAPCFAASSICLRCRSTIESLLPVHAVWTSAAFTMVIPYNPPSRLRTLAQLLRDADELLCRECPTDLVLHPVGEPHDRIGLARLGRHDLGAARAAHPHEPVRRDGERATLRGVLDHDHPAAIREDVRVAEAVTHLHAGQTRHAGELQPGLEL